MEELSVDRVGDPPFEASHGFEVSLPRGTLAPVVGPALGIEGVYYTQRGNQIVLLLCGGDKSTQQNDIAKAHQLAAHWHSKEDGDNG